MAYPFFGLSKTPSRQEIHFTEAGVESVAVTGDSSRDGRRDAIRRLEDGTLTIECGPADEPRSRTSTGSL